MSQVELATDARAFRIGAFRASAFWASANMASALVAGILVASPHSAAAQDLRVSGFLEFESHFGQNYDITAAAGSDQVTPLDSALDGQLNVDFATTARSGLEYGAHFELDLYQSDDDLYLPTSRALPLKLVYRSDIAIGDLVEFNDGYVFVTSALGKLSFGDTGTAGEATNQLHVPILSLGALELDHLTFNTEAEQLIYSNDFANLKVEASVDDDAAWALGLGYAKDVGPLMVELGLSASRSSGSLQSGNTPLNSLSGSVELSSGGVRAGVNYGSVQARRVMTVEYVAAGADYTMGPLTLGAGAETTIYHLSSRVQSELYVTNYFAGVTYDLADGLTVALGVGNLDADSGHNRANTSLIFNPSARLRSTNAIASVKVGF